MANQEGSTDGFSIDPEQLLSVLDDASALVDSGGRVLRQNSRMTRLLASEEGARLLPFVQRDGAPRLSEVAPLLEPARSAAQGIAKVLEGAKGRLEMELGTEGSSLLAIPCTVRGARGALVRVRLRSAEEEHRLRCAEVVQTMQLGLHILRLEDPEDDSSLRYVYGNPASEAITRSPISVFVGRLLDEVAAGPRENGLPERYTQVIREKKTLDFEYTWEDGRIDKTTTYAMKAFPLGGQHVGVIFENITQRKELEESLRSTSQFLDNILDNIPLMVFIKDARNLSYLHMNSVAEQAIGMPESQWLGRTDHEIFPKESAERLVAIDREVLSGREIADFPDEQMHMLGKPTRLLHTRKIPIYGEDGQPQFLIGLSEDITERRVVEEAKRRELVLLETQERLMELVRQLSTPLLPLQQGVLVAPLVGQMDEARGAQFMEALLAGVQQHQAEMVLIDITGVPAIDATVAEQLLRATRAAGLLGTTCALVGLSPEVARTMVELGVDFSGLVTYADLRAGMAAALRQRRLSTSGARQPGPKPSR
ncbi:PAS domain-containing protein [Polyangium aurulentum]|uniref:PAS domain-containing protein n=1 Tax=Polyangium aurulentum TaxID=2567896 RepID=UPI0010AECD19|nr:PAS domain-containing protein [Polyangium aurulentum]UQA61633.1 PAS domain-containing protein [Polyangium aurulentum]